MKNLIKDLHSFTMDDVEALTTCMQDRLDFEYGREPESYGMVHDDWDDRVADLEEIIGRFEDCETEDDFDEAIELIEDFQMVHGGLSRLKVL